MNKGFGFLFEMGCGKTLTAIAVAGAGYQQKRISRVLIVAPTSVVAVWPKEFQDYAAFPYTIRTLLGTKQQRLKALADLERFPYPHLKVAVINYESTWREEIFDALLDFDADLVIADESQRIKSHDAAQSKAMHQLGDKARYKLILSGTPVQNEAVDLWSQYRFLDPTIFGTNFYAFRSRYCEMGGFNRKQIVRYRDLDTLIRKEHSIAYRVTKEEALDLPEQTFENRYITLSRSERNLYDRLRRDSYAELADGGTITATTVLTKLLRLQQFTGGFLVEDDAIQPKLVSRGKLDALEDIIESMNGKPLLVAYWYQHDLNRIEERLRMRKIGFARLDSDASIAKWNRGELPVALIHPASAGHGLNLQSGGSTLCWFGLTWSLELYQQTVARLYRQGQASQTVVVQHIITDGTIDERILKALQYKDRTQSALIDAVRANLRK